MRSLSCIGKVNIYFIGGADMTIRKYLINISFTVIILLYAMSGVSSAALDKKERQLAIGKYYNNNGEIFPPELTIGIYPLKKDPQFRYAHSSSQDVRPFVSTDGKKLYFISTYGSEEKPWKAVMSSGQFGGMQLTDSNLNELAIIPSPDESKLLLLVEHEKGTAKLVVADSDGNSLADIAKKIDPAQSQFIWRFDGTRIYYTINRADGEGMALMCASPDGKESIVLIEKGVSEFDTCKTKGRIVAISDNKLVILDDGMDSRSCSLKGKPQDISISRNGDFIAYSDGKSISIYDLEKRIVTSNSSPPDPQQIIDRQPAWSFDGKRIAFQREFYREDAPGIIVAASLVLLNIADGTEEEIKQSDVVRNRIQWLASDEALFFEQLPIDSIGTTPLLDISPTEINPMPQGIKWQRTKGPYTAESMRCYAIAPSDSRILYASLGDKGVYVTTDGGDNWRMIEAKDIYTSGVNALAVDCKNPLKIYAGINNEVRWNKGAKWDLYSGQSNRYKIDKLVSHPTKSGEMFGLCDGNRRIVRIQKEDFKELKELDGFTAEDLMIDKRNPSLLIVHDRDGVAIFSLDEGETWHKAIPPKGENKIIFLTGSKTQSDLIGIQTESRAVFYSRDNGKTWEPFADPLIESLWTEGKQKNVKEIFPLLLPGEKDDGAEAPYYTRFGPKKSEPLYKKNEMGFVRSTDGGRTWQSAGNGLSSPEIFAVQPLPDVSKGLLISTRGKIMLSRDGGESWSAVKPGNLLVSDVKLTAHPHKPGLVFAHDSRLSIFRSTDYGENWQPILQKSGDSDEDLIPAFGEMNKTTGSIFEFDRKDPNHIILCTTTGLLESLDGGIKWKKIAGFVWPGQKADMQPLQFVANRESITIGRKWKRSIFQTRDMGKTWHPLAAPFQGHRDLGLIGIDGTPGALYALTKEANGPVLWASKDYGSTWEKRPLPASKGEPYSFARSPADPKMLAVGIGGSVWLSRDDGMSWHDLGRCVDVGNFPIEILIFSPADNRLYAEVLKTGIFWIELPDTK
jgi:photosystem II stability/assembly factor-like uncharacterized protein